MELSYFQIRLLLFIYYMQYVCSLLDTTFLHNSSSNYLRYQSKPQNELFCKLMYQMVCCLEKKVPIVGYYAYYFSGQQIVFFLFAKKTFKKCICRQLMYVPSSRPEKVVSLCGSLRFLAFYLIFGINQDLAFS